jgi:signal transduction histidine kinase
MSAKSWSLSRRLLFIFAASTLSIVATLSLGGAWFLKQSIERELDALLLEEHDELAAMMLATEHAPDDFARTVARLEPEHPANPMGWRVWLPDGTPGGTYGRSDLLCADAPNRDLMNRTIGLGDGLRWRTERHESGHFVGCVLDGSHQLALMRRYFVFAAALTGVSILVALLVGKLFIDRFCRLLRQVAEQTRCVHETEAPVQIALKNPPDEIREVVDALQELLRNTRQEIARAKLFVAGVAHELRSPIQNLIGETEVALMNRRDEAAYRELLVSHLEELHHLGDAVHNLVSICTSTARNGEPHLEEFDLVQEVRMRLEPERSRAQQRGVALEFDCAGDARIRGDREAILRAVRNLTDNAIEWSPPDRAVRVCIRGEERTVSVTVDDAGPGVSEELRGKVFEPFFSGPSRSGRRQGYGLGLTIVRSAVEKHGGTIDIGSSPLGGARFHMTIAKT